MLLGLSLRYYARCGGGRIHESPVEHERPSDELVRQRAGARAPVLAVVDAALLGLLDGPAVPADGDHLIHPRRVPPGAAQVDLAALRKKRFLITV